MMKPTIHRNGTSAEDLYADYTKASQGIYDAILAVQRSGPNARDYYLQPSGAFSIALAEHEDRLNRLNTVRYELEAIIEEVSKHL